jgi:hypothetical protein
MPRDVLITPLSGLIDFKDLSGNNDAFIQINDSGDLTIGNPGGTLSIGNTASNLYIGDGTTSVDIIFEQNGKIRGLTNKTVTLGQSDSFVTTASPFGFLSPDGTKQITARMLNTDVLSFQGGAGELLSLSDSMTGTIFSVNDVSGIPSIEVLDTGVIKLAQYSGDVKIGSSEINVGYRNIPWSGGADKTSSYTLALGDIGKFVSLGTSGAITVPASTFAAGDIISLYNNTTGNITITCSAVTTYIGGTNTTKTSVTLATRGICSIFFYSASVCIITGNVS